MGELVSATLICVKRGLGEHYIVDGLVLPNSKRLISRRANLVSPVSPPVEKELQWPQDMLDCLGEFFARTQARSFPQVRSFPGVDNCHTFGAEVTGQRRRLRLSPTLGILNAEIGNRVEPKNSSNTVLYGIVKDGKVIHTLVGTQDPGMSLSTGSNQDFLRYEEIGAQEEGYGGELHAYTLVET